MAKRLTFSRSSKRFSKMRSNDSMEESKILNPDTNIMVEEEIDWWNNLDETTPSPHFSKYSRNETSQQLNMNSQLESNNDTSRWWKYLESSNIDNSIKSSPNLSAEIVKTNVLETSESMSESEEELRYKKRRVPLRGGDKRTSSNAFLNILNNKEDISLKQQSKRGKYSNSHNDSDIELLENNLDEEHNLDVTLTPSPNILKLKPRIYKRRNEKIKDKNSFHNIVTEDSKRKSVTLEKESSNSSKHQNITTNKDYTEDLKKTELLQTSENNETGSLNLLTLKVVLENNVASDINKTVETTNESISKSGNNKRFKFKSHLMRRANLDNNNPFEDILVENRNITLSEHNQDKEIGIHDTESSLKTKSLSSPSRKIVDRFKRNTDNVARENTKVSLPVRKSPRSLKTAKKDSFDTSVQAQSNIEQSTSNSSLDADKSHNKKPAFFKLKSKMLSLHKKSLTDSSFKEILRKDGDDDVRKSNITGPANQDKEIDIRDRESPLKTKSLSSPSRKIVNRFKRNTDNVARENAQVSLSVRRSPRSLKTAKRDSFDTLVQAQSNIEQSTSNSSLDADKSHNEKPAFLKLKSKMLSLHKKSLTDSSFKEILRKDSDDDVRKSNITGPANQDKEIDIHDRESPLKTKSLSSPSRKIVDRFKRSTENVARENAQVSLSVRRSPRSLKTAKRDLLGDLVQVKSNIEQSTSNSSLDADKSHNEKPAFFKLKSKMLSSHKKSLTDSPFKEILREDGNDDVRKSNITSPANQDKEIDIHDRESPLKTTSLSSPSRKIVDRFKRNAENVAGENVRISSLVDRSPRSLKTTKKDSLEDTSAQVQNNTEQRTSNSSDTNKSHNFERPTFFKLKSKILSSQKKSLTDSPFKEILREDGNVDARKNNITRPVEDNHISVVQDKKITEINQEQEQIIMQENLQSKVENISEGFDTPLRISSSSSSNNASELLNMQSEKKNKHSGNNDINISKSISQKNIILEDKSKASQQNKKQEISFSRKSLRDISEISKKHTNAVLSFNRTNTNEIETCKVTSGKISFIAKDSPFTSNVRNWPTSQVNVENFEKIKAEVDKIKINEMAAIEMAAEKKKNALKVSNVKFLSATLQRAKKNPPKIIDKAYKVNGKVYKPPKLPRPKHWATDHLYNFLWKRMEPKYKLSTRVRSEKFVLLLAKIMSIIERRKKYENYKLELEALMKEMARLNIIDTRNDFHHFCQDYLPYEFRIKVIPMLLPGNKQNIPFDLKKLHTPLLEEI